MNLIHTFPPYFYKIHYNIIFSPGLDLPNGLSPSGFPTKICIISNSSQRECPQNKTTKEILYISKMRVSFPLFKRGSDCKPKKTDWSRCNNTGCLHM
jgi:hypothetical protein